MAKRIELPVSNENYPRQEINEKIQERCLNAPSSIFTVKCLRFILDDGNLYPYASNNEMWDKLEAIVAKHHH